MPCIAIFTADGLDLIAYSEAEAKRHMKDLKGMGFEPKRKAFPSDAEAYDYCERKGISC